MKIVCALSAVVFLSGCAGYYNEQSADRVPTAVIANSLKCDLAKYFVYEHAHRGPPFIIENGEDIPAVLSLNVVTSSSIKGSLDVQPSVLTFSGGSIGLGFSSNVKRTITTLRQIDVNFTPSASDDRICDGEPKEYLRGGVGLYQWLVDIRTDMENTRRGAPLMLVDKLTYSTEFGVERVTGESAQFAFIALKAGLEGTQSRSDVQSIKVTFATKKQAKPKVAQKPAPTTPCDPKTETCPKIVAPPKPPACNPKKETCPMQREPQVFL